MTLQHVMNLASYRARRAEHKRSHTTDECRGREFTRQMGSRSVGGTLHGVDTPHPVYILFMHSPLMDGHAIISSGGYLGGTPL